MIETGTAPQLSRELLESSFQDVSSRKMMHVAARRDEIVRLRKEIDSTEATKTYPLLFKINRLSRACFLRGNPELKSISSHLKMISTSLRDLAMLSAEDSDSGSLKAAKDRFNKNRPQLREAIDGIVAKINENLSAFHEYQDILTHEDVLQRTLRGARRAYGTSKWDAEAKNAGSMLVGAALYRLVADAKNVDPETIRLPEDHPHQRFLSLAVQLSAPLCRKILGLPDTAVETASMQPVKEETQVDFDLILETIPEKIFLPAPCKEVIRTLKEHGDKVSRTGDLATFIKLSSAYLQVLVSKVYKAFGLTELPRTQKLAVLKYILQSERCPPIEFSEGRGDGTFDPEILDEDDRSPSRFTFYPRDSSVIIVTDESEYRVPLPLRGAGIDETILRRSLMLRSMGITSDPPDGLEGRDLKNWYGEKLVDLYRNGDPSHQLPIFNELLHCCLLVAIRMPSIRKYIYKHPESLIACATDATNDVLAKFDPAKGALDSYTLEELKYTFLELFRETSTIPRSLYEKHRNLEKIESAHNNPRDANRALQQAGHDDGSLLKLRQSMLIARATSYDAALGERETLTLDDISDGRAPWHDPADDDAPLIETHEHLMFLKAMDWLAESSPREHFVLSLIKDGTTLREIADQLGLSESRVSQIKDKGIALIQEHLELERTKPDKTGRAAIKNPTPANSTHGLS